MGLAGNYGIRDVTDKMPDWVVISPNAPEAMSNLIDECLELNIPFLYDPSQQIARLDGEALLHGIRNCQMLTVNEYEWEVVEKKTGLTLPEVIRMGKTLVITKGKDGAHIYHDGATYFIPPVQSVTIVDPTGVGDAFRAGLLVGMSHGWAWDICGKIGSLCAAYVLEKVGTQNHHFTPAEFVERFRREYDDAGVLDVLLEAGQSA